MSEAEEQTTIPVSQQDLGEAVQTSLELHVRDARGQRLVHPFHRNVLEIGFGSTQVRFNHLNGEVLFRGLKLEDPIYKDGKVTPWGRLEVGNFLEIGEHRVLLWDHGQPLAYLKAYSPPYAGEIWPLGPGEHPVGRPGKRMNAVRLDHPTVSREHAMILCEPGGYRIRAESSASLVCVAGNRLEPGSEVGLAHGDMVEFGEMVLRFHCPIQTVSGCDLIRVRSLSGFHVQIGGTKVPDKDWKTQQIKWMLAYLAYQWGKPVALDAVVDQLWPDLTPEKARNNLNYSVSTLRQTLRSRLPESMRQLEVVMRSSSTLQLNPDVLDQHDVVAIQRHLQMARDKSSPKWELHAERALMDFSGPFLPDCYLDWVQPIRQALELEVNDLGQQLLQRRAGEQRWEAVVPLATKLLQVDLYSSAACQHLIVALSSSGQPQGAVKVYEQYRQILQRDLDQEPDVELQREYLRAQLLL